MAWLVVSRLWITVVNGVMVLASFGVCLDFSTVFALMKSRSTSRSSMKAWLADSSFSVKVEISSADEESATLASSRKPTAFIVEATWSGIFPSSVSVKSILVRDLGV